MGITNGYCFGDKGSLSCILFGCQLGIYLKHYFPLSLICLAKDGKVFGSLSHSKH
jgi:hypothetical protein